MAFVHVGAAVPRTLRSSSFCGCAVAEASVAPVAAPQSRRAPRMLVEDGEVVPAKGSSWRETFFGVGVAGGIPGGEKFYRDWVDSGMEGEFSDMPEKLQPGQPKVEKPKSAPTLLERVDKMEFFKDYEGVGVEEEEEKLTGVAGAASKAGSAAKGAATSALDRLASLTGKKTDGASDAAASAASKTIKIGGKAVSKASSAVSSVASDAANAFTSDASEKQTLVERASMIADAMAEVAAAADPEAPDESLYAPYFPKATRNLAPDLSFVCERDFYKDRVSMAMTEVKAKCTDVYFPKETEGKAPIIDISYNGVLTGASISVKLDDVTPLPATAPLVPAGVPAASLVPGSGGGLKLEYIVDGQEVSAYSDPRCIDNFSAMVK